MEIDLLIGELHKLQTEAATRSSRRSTRDDRTTGRPAYAEIELAWTGRFSKHCAAAATLCTNKLGKVSSLSKGPTGFSSTLMKWFPSRATVAQQCRHRRAAPGGVEQPQGLTLHTRQHHSSALYQHRSRCASARFKGIGCPHARRFPPPWRADKMPGGYVVPFYNGRCRFESGTNGAAVGADDAISARNANGQAEIHLHSPSIIGVWQHKTVLAGSFKFGAQGFGRLARVKFDANANPDCAVLERRSKNSGFVAAERRTKLALHLMKAGQCHRFRALSDELSDPHVPGGAGGRCRRLRESRW